MNDYERQLFNGKCPYTDEPCDRDIECHICEVEEAERDYMTTELFERFKEETNLSEEIKRKLHDVCNYMWTHDLSKITVGYTSGVKFTIRKEVDE